ncbi:MAG: uroporphyrinogen-III C-methyltransferase [Huintestinicola sp.]
MTGKVYLVGAGCGSADLITLRGERLIRCCDTVVYDSLIDEGLLSIAPEQAERICVGKRAGGRSERQENINDILVKKALEGKTVVRLKGGDPFVFGRGGEEAAALSENHIPFEVVPGISSSIAVPELAGIPVTHRRISRSFHVITGHTAEDLLPENMSEYARLDGTLVFLMGLKNLREIAGLLISNGKSPDTPAAVISNGGRNNQRTVRAVLSRIADAAEREKIEAPAVIVVGETARYDFLSDEKKPLCGFSAALTGTRHFTEKLGSKLSALGADISVVCPMEICVYNDNPEFDKAVDNIRGYTHVILTSPNGAEIFFDRLKRRKKDIRELYGIRFAVIGKGTADILESHGIYADIIPESFNSEALAKAVAEVVSEKDRILILRAEQGSRALTDILESGKIAFDDIKTYDVICGQLQEGHEITSDCIIFSSGSGVKGFFESGNTISENTNIICIGEASAAVLKKYCGRECLIPDTADAEGIARLIAEKFGKE